MTTLNPTVSIITPTTHDRAHFNERIAEIANTQTYPYIIEHLFDYSHYSIGTKRNNLCEAAKGDIILHMDSDDLYSPEWVQLSVDALQGCDLTGLNLLYFASDIAAWQYSCLKIVGGLVLPVTLAGATMCYWRSTWARKGFKDVQTGEDVSFCANAGRVVPHGNIYDFCATVHANNTIFKDFREHEYKPVDRGLLKERLKVQI